MSKRIKLTQGFTAIVDEQDYRWLKKHKWCAKKSATNWYAVRGQWDGSGIKIIRMHREIMAKKLGRAVPKNKEVHHKDDNGMNNRRRNLKVTTQLQNLSYKQ